MNNENSTGNEWMTMGEQIMYMCKLNTVCPWNSAHDRKLMTSNVSRDFCCDKHNRSRCGIP